MSPRLVVLDALEALIDGPSREAFRLGAVLPLSGLLGQSGPSALEAVILACEELQRTKLPLQRPIELVLVDSGISPGAIAHSVSQLVQSGAVEAFVGLHTSDVMEAIEKLSIGHPVPYVFTAGHESRPQPLGFFSSGESPKEMAQGVQHVIMDRDIREWAIVGSDYIWPRAVGAAAREVIENNSGRVAVERVVPLRGAADAARDLISDVVKSGAKGLVVSMPGRELITLLTALRGSELDRQLVTCSGTLEENVLYALGGDSTGNLYATQHSFETLHSPRRLELTARFEAALGEGFPALNSWAEHCYDAVHLIVGLERSDMLNLVNMSVDDASVHPEALKLRPDYSIQLAVAAGLNFEVV